MANSKNRLQEYFQKNQLPLPQYISVRNGGSDHQPLWKSTVTLYNGEQFHSDNYPSKNQAEISVALMALDAILSPKLTLSVFSEDSNSSNIDVSEKESIKTAILVDVENLPKFIDAIVDRIKNYTVYAFVGEHHCLSDKEFPNGVIKILSPSTRTNGTDTTMQVYTGMLLAKESYDNYFIVTRDHFGSALVEAIMTPNLGWVAKSAKLITKPSQL